MPYWIVEHYVGNFEWGSSLITTDEDAARLRFEELERELPHQRSAGVRLTKVGQ